MIKQTLMFTSPVSLSLKDQQIVITFKDNKDIVTRPIEDIGFVVIKNPQASISVPLLNELADNNVSVIFLRAASGSSTCKSLFTKMTSDESKRLAFASFFQ